MKNVIFAAALLLLTARGAQAGIFEFKSYSFANYGSPFYLVETTPDNLYSAINGGAIGGNWGRTTLDELLQEGASSVSDSYDPGAGLHIAYSAEAVYRPAEPLSTTAPGIGANASASNNQYLGENTVIGETFVYLKHTISINNPTTRDDFLKSYAVTTSVDGVINGSGDGFAQVGQAIRVTLDDGSVFSNASISTYTPDYFSGPYNTYAYGRPVPLSSPPLTLSSSGPYGTDLINHSSHSMTIETLLYVRAQTGGYTRGAGTAGAEFSNTQRVTNIQFFDENDQVIPDLQMIGFNGDAYPYNAVPEPSTLALFGIGFIGLLFARVRRRICR